MGKRGLHIAKLAELKFFMPKEAVFCQFSQSIKEPTVLAYFFSKELFQDI